MEKKPTTPGAAPAPRPSEKAGAHRHRFGDSEKTTVMPLSEILRQRDPGGDDGSQDTKLTPPPSLGGADSDFGQVPTRLARNPGAAAGRPAAGRGPATPPPVQAKTGFARANAKPQATTDEIRDTSTQQAVGGGGGGGGETQLTSPDQLAAQARALKEKGQVQAKGPAEKKEQPRPATPPTRSNPELRVASKGDGKRKQAVPTNQVVVFFSCKGGSGATALSANVAHYYAQDQYKTCLVDMDLQLGDGLAALGLQSRTTIAQSMEAVMRGESLTNQTLPRHASGVSVMSQVGSLDDLDKITSEGMAALVEGLRTSFDVVVVDGVRDFSDNVLAVLDVADRIAIVTVQEVLAIRRARWAFGILRKIGFDPKDVTVVVNKFDAESEISFLTLKKIFEPGKVMAIPSEGRLVLQSLNRGVPLLELSAGHSLTRNIGRMAANLLGENSLDLSEATVIRKQQQKGLLQRIAFWRKK